ncbi:uncharacterized protein LOC121736074 [Aricia agestis]|nr:uncharacterized protein LOC121736074 [Aricia agestis]
MAKKDGWNEIAEKFGITNDEAYKKFRSLRTYALNEQKKNKSGSAGGRIVKWFAYDAISFVYNQNTANTGLDSENATPNVETANTDDSAGPEEVVNTDTTDSVEILDTSPKPRTKRPKTVDPLLEKAQNIIRGAGETKRNEYAGFGEHIANKLSKYDDYTRAQAELKIMQILFECDMSMHRTRPLSRFTPSPNSSRGGASTSQSQYSDISILPRQNNIQYVIVPNSQDVNTSIQTQSEQNTLQHVLDNQSQVPQSTTYEELVSYTLQYDESQK